MWESASARDVSPSTSLHVATVVEERVKVVLGWHFFLKAHSCSARQVAVTFTRSCTRCQGASDPVGQVAAHVIRSAMRGSPAAAKSGGVQRMAGPCPVKYARSPYAAPGVRTLGDPRGFQTSSFYSADIARAIGSASWTTSGATSRRHGLSYWRLNGTEYSLWRRCIRAPRASSGARVICPTTRILKDTIHGVASTRGGDRRPAHPVTSENVEGTFASSGPDGAVVAAL